MKIRLKGLRPPGTPDASQTELKAQQATVERNSGLKREQASASGEEQDPEVDFGDPDYNGSESGSSGVADDDFLNAPLELPDSSGDEYTDPNAPVSRPARGSGRSHRRRRHFESTSPRPRRESHRARRIPDSEQEEEEQEEAEDLVRQPSATAPRKVARPAGNTQRKRGRPSKEKEKDDDPTFSIRLWTGQSRYQDTSGRDSMDIDADTPGVEDEDLDGDDAEGEDSRAGSLGPGPGLGISGRRKGGPLISGSEKQVKGKRYTFEEDELQLPEDPKGAMKVDRFGNLLGGREYKATTFKSPNRPQPDRVYMLAIDAARCAGFRDSLYFFRRNPWIQKINANQAEKDLLVEKKMLHINLRTRQVSIITALNCYKVFGARFIKHGRNVDDDYYEDAARARGLVPGTPAFIESYDPEVDNTTLAMPKIGAFALKKGEGRPAYMKMAKAFEQQQPVDDDNIRMATPELEELAEKENAKTKAKKDKDEESSSSEESDGRGGRRKKRKRTNRSAPFFVLQLNQNYLPNAFGANGNAGPQFGGNGLPPFGDGWERSKARKPAPHLNGRNWMFETAKSVQRINKAVRNFNREYNAYHAITLGAMESNAVLEEAEGVWDSADDATFPDTGGDTVERDGFESHSDGETVDDRKRGRSPVPISQGRSESGVQVKEEIMYDNHDMDLKATKRNRRRRSPIRGHYEQHSRAPQVRTGTQATRVIICEQVALEPCFNVKGSERHTFPAEVQRPNLLADKNNLDTGISRKKAQLYTVEYSVVAS